MNKHIFLTIPILLFAIPLFWLQRVFEDPATREFYEHYKGRYKTMMDYMYYDDMFTSETVPYMPASTFKAIRTNNKGLLIKRRSK